MGPRLLVTMAILTLGCSPSSGDSQWTDCAQRTGSYRFSLRERDGDCGHIPEQIETLERQPTAVPEPCSGSIRCSADNCRVTSDVTCPEDSIEPGATSTIESVTDWDATGDRGTGIMQMIVFAADGSIFCQSTYDTEAERI